MLSAGLLAFVTSLGELGAAVCLYTTNTQVIVVDLLNLGAEGDWPLAAVISLTLLALTFAIAAMGYRLLGRSVLVGPSS